MEPKRLHPGAILENGATLEGGAVFSLIIMFRKKWLYPLKWHRLAVDAMARFSADEAFARLEPCMGGAELHTMKRLQGFFSQCHIHVFKQTN